MTMGERRAAAATSSDVAEAAGVSRSTVSYILNGKTTRFPRETRDRVLAAADELGYRPSHAGRALATGKSDVVVLLLPSASFGPILQEGIDRLAGVTYGLGLTLLVRFAGPDTQESLRAVLTLKPAAIVDLGVLDPATRTRLRTEGTTVLPGPDEGDPNQIDTLVGRLQVEEALQRGPRTLIYASKIDARPDPIGPVRLAGAREAAKERGVTIDHIDVPLDPDGATEALSGAARANGPWAVCCFNDEVAIAVLAAARSLHLAVPRDVSVIGVDHTILGQLVEPRLTSVSIDFAGFMERMLVALDPNRDESDLPDPRDGVRLVPGDST